MGAARLEQGGTIHDLLAIDAYGAFLNLAIGLGAAGGEARLFQDLRQPQAFCCDRDRDDGQILRQLPVGETGNERGLRALRWPGSSCPASCATTCAISMRAYRWVY